MARERTADIGVPISEDLSLPAGDYELWLEPGTISNGHYTVELDREDPFDPAPSLDATVAVSTDTEEVAAYWQAGQHVTGQVTITNTGAAAETLQLDAVTSHYAWAASLGQDQVDVAAGATVTVPLDDHHPTRRLGGRSRAGHGSRSRRGRRPVDRPCRDDAGCRGRARGPAPGLVRAAGAAGWAGRGRNGARRTGRSDV